MTVSTRQKIAKDTLFLIGRSVAVRGLSLPVSLLTARVLGPETFGLLGIINQVPGLAKFGSLGFGSVAFREISHIRDEGRVDRESEIRNVSFTADLLWSLLITAVVLSVSFFFDRVEVRWGLRIAAVPLS